ncbi:MAG: hypothetical protein Q8O72_12490 [Bacteroidales bacterium]|nr:hypothetical protein [Bacteroidales bacterium]
MKKMKNTLKLISVIFLLSLSTNQIYSQEITLDTSRSTEAVNVYAGTDIAPGYLTKWTNSLPPTIANSMAYEGNNKITITPLSGISTPIEALLVKGNIGLAEVLDFNEESASINWGNTKGIGKLFFATYGLTVNKTIMTLNGIDGFVGIGTETPANKLHIKGKTGEATALFIEPSVWDDGTAPGGGDVRTTFSTTGAYLLLGNASHGIGAKMHQGLIFSTEYGYIFDDGYLKLGKGNPHYGDVLTCIDAQGNARWSPIEMPDPSPWLPCGTSDIHYSEGNVGIGTDNTGGYKLAVNGNINAKLLKISVNVPASDYVFQEDYKLMPLYELERFVNKNQHLPEVKSAKEFKEEGYNVGDMDDVLLRKVEELTLYTIEQQKQIDAQKKLVDVLIQQVKELNQQLVEKDNQ